MPLDHDLLWPGHDRRWDQLVINVWFITITASIEKANAEKASTGTISAATATEVVLALNGGELFNLLVDLSKVIGLVTFALVVITNIYGFLAMTAASIIMGFIVDYAFNAQNAPQAQASLSEQQVKTAVNDDGTYNPSICMSIARDQIEGADPDTGSSLEGWAFIASEWVVVLSYWAYLETGKMFGGKISLVIAALSFAIGACANILGNKMIAALGIFASVVSYTMDVLEAVTNWGENVNKIPTVISVGTSTMGLCLSVYVLATT